MRNSSLYHHNCSQFVKGLALILWRSLQLGAAAMPPDEPPLNVEDLADQVAEVLDHFGLVF